MDAHMKGHILIESWAHNVQRAESSPSVRTGAQDGGTELRGWCIESLDRGNEGVATPRRSWSHASLLIPPLLPRLLGASRPLAGGLEHRPLHRPHALLEAGRARPWEACGGCKSAGERRVRQACLSVVVERRAEATRQQLAALPALFALTRGGREAGTLRGLAHRLQRESGHRKDGLHTHTNGHPSAQRARALSVD